MNELVTLFSNENIMINNLQDILNYVDSKFGIVLSQNLSENLKKEVREHLSKIKDSFSEMSNAKRLTGAQIYQVRYIIKILTAINFDSLEQNILFTSNEEVKINILSRLNSLNNSNYNNLNSREEELTEKYNTYNNNYDNFRKTNFAETSAKLETEIRKMLKELDIFPVPKELEEIFKGMNNTIANNEQKYRASEKVMEYCRNYVNPYYTALSKTSKKLRKQIDDISPDAKNKNYFLTGENYPELPLIKKILLKQKINSLKKLESELSAGLYSNTDGERPQGIIQYNFQFPLRDIASKFSNNFLYMNMKNAKDKMEKAIGSITTIERERDKEINDCLNDATKEDDDRIKEVSSRIKKYKEFLIMLKKVEKSKKKVVSKSYLLKNGELKKRFIKKWFNGKELMDVFNSCMDQFFDIEKDGKKIDLEERVSLFFERIIDKDNNMTMGIDSIRKTVTKQIETEVSNLQGKTK